MSKTQLICSSCGAALGEGDLDPQRPEVAICRFCGTLTRLPREASAVPNVPAPAAASDSARPSTAARSKVPRPDSVSYAETMDGIRLTYRWFSPALFFGLFFCIAWDSFLIFWYAMGIGGVGQMGPMGILFFVFPIGHIAVGIGLTYFVIAGFLNRTWIDATRDELCVRHGPVPWKGNKRLVVGDIDQLFSSLGTWESQNAQTNSHSYCVSILMKDGRKEKLVGLLHSADEARYIERTIEEFLGLEHHPVAGELA